MPGGGNKNFQEGTVRITGVIIIVMTSLLFVKFLSVLFDLTSLSIRIRSCGFRSVPLFSSALLMMVVAWCSG